jgi:short-subunit dehydrogenase
MKSNNKYALVTGATSGIGYELAKLLAQDGYNLVIVARNHDELNVKEKEFRAYGIEVIVMAKTFSRLVMFILFTLILP